MALSEDQKAMLKLVSQPDTSYEDIAALMGLSVAEVRAKVDDALAQLDQGAQEAPPAPTPEPTPDPEPEQSPPTPDASAVVHTRVRNTPEARTEKSKGALKLPEDKGARRGIFAGGAVLLIFVLLLVTGVLGDSDDDTGAGGDTVAASEAAGDGREPTQAVLESVGGTDASGRALFGRAGKQVVLLVRVERLAKAPSGRSYTISIAKSSGERVPLIASVPNEKREIVGSFKIAPQILGLLASGYDTMEVSLVPNGELSAALKAAQKSGTAPTYGGATVARGEVSGPIVEAGEGS